MADIRALALVYLRTCPSLSLSSSLTDSIISANRNRKNIFFDRLVIISSIFIAFSIQPVCVWVDLAKAFHYVTSGKRKLSLLLLPTIIIIINILYQGAWWISLFLGIGARFFELAPGINLKHIGTRILEFIFWFHFLFFPSCLDAFPYYWWIKRINST